jgi:hypothetical protein
MLAAFAYRSQVIGLVFALGGCQSGIPNIGTSGVQQGGAPISPASHAGAVPHLYVATVSNQVLAIERHRLRKGIPAKAPDHVYTGSGLLALAGNGTLYSTLALSPIVVDVFSPGSEKPVRRIDVDPGCHFSSSGFNVVKGIAADASGYLFVLIYSYPGAAPSRASRGADSSPEARTPCNGVAVYAPNAKGKAHPVQAIRLSNSAGLDGLAVDGNDNLYVAGGSSVNEYANAIVDPTLTRTFSGKYLGTVRAIATDAAGDVFIANAQQSYSSAWIDRYSSMASGGGPPTSMFDLEGSGPHWLWSIAVHRRYLYVDDTGTSVDVYDALKNGAQSPVDSLVESKKIDTIAADP